MEAIRYYCAPTKQYSGICDCSCSWLTFTNSRILLGWCAVVPNCLHSGFQFSCTIFCVEGAVDHVSFTLSALSRTALTWVRIVVLYAEGSHYSTIGTVGVLNYSS